MSLALENIHKIGTCCKCGKVGIIQDHHWKGYSEEHKDNVMPYCHSCDLRAHAKARREGQCKLPHEKVNVLSKNSYRRRNEERIEFWEVVGTNALFQECIIFNKSNGNVYVTSRFLGNHGVILPEVIV